MAANQQGQEQKKLYEEQARVQREETATATTMKSDDRRRMLASQRMAYLANGVELTGTPLVVGDDTFNEYQKEIDALKTSGAAKSYLLSKQGEQAATSGRTQLVSSLFSAGSTVAQSGLFK
jgi:Skp family chaperone for outer membrane proteins